jgi:hypothetical protein
MIALLGALIIISGFLSPFFKKGEIPSSLFFWIGFLVLFASRRFYPRHELWMKWASRGVLLNAFGTLVLIQVIGILAVSKKYNILAVVLKGGNYIFSPISMAVKFRSTVTSFLDVLVFIGLGIVVGKLFIKKHYNDGITTENN